MDALKNLIRKLDDVFSRIIRKAKYCKRCATTTGVEPAHIFGRKNLSVRWDLDNAIPLCRKCHSWAHSRQKDFKDWVRRLYGDDRYYSLVARANAIKKWTIGELEELYNSLNEKANKI